MAFCMHEVPPLRGAHAGRVYRDASQMLHRRPPTAARRYRCPHLYRSLQTPASSRFFDIRIQSSWGSGPSSSSGTDTVSSRWWSGGRDTGSPSQLPQPAQDSSGSSSTPGRFSNLFNKEGSSYSNGSPSVSTGTSSSVSGSSYTYGGGTISSQSSTAVDNAAPWVLAALLPTMVWCLTWTLTGGMVTLTNTCMGGMTSIAQLLFPSLPVKGVNYEDIAVSLVKSLHTDTDHPLTWTRPGLYAPAWVMRVCMATMFNLASASSSVAANLIPVPQWLAVSGTSQGLMYFTCLLLMLPLGAGLRSFGQQLGLVAKRYKLAVPRLGLPVGVPKLNDNTALALKLSGLLAWPCISAAAILQPLISAQSRIASFPVAASQVAVCVSALLLLLTVAVTAGRFAAKLLTRKADTDAVQDFGFRLGLICAAQAVLNVGQVGLGLVGGQIAPAQLVMPVVSTLILGRVVWSIWRLYRIGAATPSMWLQLLTFAPEIKTAAPASGIN